MNELNQRRWEERLASMRLRERLDSVTRIAAQGRYREQALSAEGAK
jgi:hypothetical protein